MFSLEKIDLKYKSIARVHGIEIRIEYCTGLPQIQEIEETDTEFVIKLDASKIGETDYEEFLSYNVRKILLPRLYMETDRLILRRFARSDSEDFFALLSNKEDAYLDSGIFFTGMGEDFNRLMDDFAAQMRYSLVQKETGHVIGTINLLDSENRAVDAREIGYAIAPGQRRLGYAYEALSAFLSCLLCDLNLGMVTAEIIPDNIPSIRLIEKLGFQYEGQRRKALWNKLRGAVDLKYYCLEKTAPLSMGGDAV